MCTATITFRYTLIHRYIIHTIQYPSTSSTRFSYRHLLNLSSSITCIPTHGAHIEKDQFLHSVKKSLTIVSCILDIYCYCSEQFTMSFSTRAFLLLVLVNVCRAGWFFGPSATTGSKGIDLLQAAKKGELKHVQEALKANANIETKSKDGYTALIYAVAKGHIDIVNFLVDAGADVNAHDNDGVTVLEFATQKGYSEIATVLIDSGAISGLNNKENGAKTKTRSSHSSKKSKRKKREKKASKCKLLLYHSFIFFKLTHILFFFPYLFFSVPPEFLAYVLILFQLVLQHWVNFLNQKISTQKKLLNGTHFII